MLYSADGSRLFSCGTGKDGDSFLVEWNESEGAIKRTYSGFRKKSVGVEQFDTTQNHFLAVGEDHQIKFWNMDNNDILTSMDAEGGLPNGVDPMARNMEKPKTLDDVTDKTKPWQLAEIIDPAQCRQVTMPDSMDAVNKVARLLYTNSGFDVLALGSNGIQKLWKWTRSEQNPGGKATANVVPQQWQPNSGLVMTNDVTGVNLEEAVPYIALSKNDSYVMSACGGKCYQEQLLIK
ncbi:topless-related protein 2-like isoform X6 [Camellia sinensis]|uniref:topless-related protein 2-like isoform X6 n=1 Tax=Camellia sinensis TaxID=4442 RepID=UPI001035CF2A|nr:topless-related protein 2-like isoform X6 [Camellia sinensis]